MNHLGSHEDKPGRITQASDYADNSLGETVGGIVAGLQGSGVFEDNGDPPKLKFPQIGDKVMEPLEGGLLGRLITGGRTYSNYWSVDNDGNISGLVPHTGTPPDLGFGKLTFVSKRVSLLTKFFKGQFYPKMSNYWKKQLEWYRDIIAKPHLDGTTGKKVTDAARELHETRIRQINDWIHSFFNKKMNYLAITSDNKYFILNDIEQEKVVINNITYHLDSGGEKMIGFIDWFFSTNNHLIKIDIHLFQKYLSEDIEKRIIENMIINFIHPYNLCTILVSEQENLIDERSSIFQTFSYSAFLVKKNEIHGFLIDLSVVYNEKKSFEILS